MATPPRLSVTGLPGVTIDDASATASPARGAEMTNFLRTRLNQKNRAPPLVHNWDFWHDRQHRPSAPSSSAAAAAPQNGNNDTAPPNLGPGYEERLEHLAGISDVREFWSVFNNFDISQLIIRDSVHLFHRGVKPLWEDARNAKGGSWTFRIPRPNAATVWRDVCLMAIGERLQNAVEDPSRVTFRDDICGVSLSVRFTSVLVQVWNRDGDHAEGVKKILETVLENLSEGLTLKEGSYYYKKHNEHSSFGNGEQKA